MSPLRGMLLLACLTLFPCASLRGLPPLAVGPPILSDAGDPLPPGALARLGSARFRAGGPVIQLAFAPDGKLLASGSNEGIVSIWETATGREVRQLKGRPWGITWFAFTSDGKAVVLVGENMTFQTWDIATGKKLRHFAGPPTGIQHLSFAPNGELVVVAGNDQSIRVWEVTTGRELTTLVPPPNQQNPGGFFNAAVMAFAGDSQLVAVGGNLGNGTAVRVWHARTGTELPRWPSQQNQGFQGLVFALDAKTLAVREAGQSTRYIETSTGREIRQTTARVQFGPFAEAFAPDNLTLAAVNGDRILLEDVITGKELRQFPAGQQGVTALAFAPGGRILASGGNNRIIRLWDAHTGKELFQTTGHQGEIHSLAYSPDGKLLASMGADQTIRLWEARSGRELRRLARTLPTGGDEMGVGGLSATVAFSPDGQIVAAAWVDGWISLWESATGKERGKFSVPNNPGFGPLAFAPDGKTLAWGAADGTVRLREVASGKVLRQFPAFKTQDTGGPVPEGAARLIALTYSPDGKTLAAAGYDYNPLGAGRGEEAVPGVRLLEVATGRERHYISFRAPSQGGVYGLPWFGGGFNVWGGFGGMVAFRNVWIDDDGNGSAGVVSSVAFAPHGRLLALATAGNIVLWDLARNREVRRFGCQQSLSRSVAFSPDGKLLATGSGDGVVHLWETATGTELAACPGHRGPVYVVAFSADGKTLSSGGADTSVLVWDADTLVRMGRTPPAVLSAAKLEALWKDLADADAARAYQAVTALAEMPGPAVAFLQERLKPFPVASPQLLQQLLADLDRDQYDVRRRATEDLEKLDTVAEAALRKALEGKPSLEVQRRVTALLDKLQGPVSTPEVLRQLRAVEVLEQIGTDEARKLLSQLAGGAPAARLTREACAAVERLARTP